MCVTAHGPGRSVTPTGRPGLAVTGATGLGCGLAANHGSTDMNSTQASLRNIPLSLLLLRLGVLAVMLTWTLEKFILPDNLARLFGGFYGMGGVTRDCLPIGGVVCRAGVLWEGEGS